MHMKAKRVSVTVLTARNTKTTKPNSGTNPANSAAIRTNHHKPRLSPSASSDFTSPSPRYPDPLPFGIRLSHYYGILSFSYDYSINTILTYAHDTMLTALLIISGIPGHRNKLHVFKSSYC
jgi:hypothetical protein